MPTTTIEGRPIHTLDLTVPERLAIVDAVIAIEEKAATMRGRDQARFREGEMNQLKVRFAAQNPDAAEFIERKLRPGGDDPVPLDHPHNPAMFLPHQQGRAPITLREMKANYERVLSETKGVTDGE